MQKLKEYLLIPTLPLTQNAKEFNWEHPELIHHDAILDVADSFVGYTTGTASLNSQQKLALSSIFFLIAGILGSVNIRLNSFLLTSQTELTIGAGTGSSASFVVSLAAALVQYVKLRSGRGRNLSKEEYKPCFWDVEDGKGFSKRELDMICRWAFCAEKIIHGTPSGKRMECLSPFQIVSYKETVLSASRGYLSIFKRFQVDCTLKNKKIYYFGCFRLFPFILCIYCYSPVFLL